MVSQLSVLTSINSFSLLHLVETRLSLLSFILINLFAALGRLHLDPIRSILSCIVYKTEYTLKLTLHFMLV